MTNSRSKGARGEREVVKLLRDWLGPVVRRCWERAQARGHDVDVPGWGIEVKRYQRIALHRWFEQASEQAARLNVRAVLVHREDRGEWLATVRLEDWVEMSRESIVEALEGREATQVAAEGSSGPVDGSGGSVAPSGDGVA